MNSALALIPAADASAFVRNPLLLIRFRFPSILAASKEYFQYLPCFPTVISRISSSAFLFQRILYDERNFLYSSIKNLNIARAFLKNAPIILLDEATASLEVDNETLIQTALSRLIKNKTVLVIAHRMRTVSGADKVVVLSDGTVAEQGSPEELMRSGKIYPRMMQLQLMSGSWEI